MVMNPSTAKKAVVLGTLGTVVLVTFASINDDGHLPGVRVPIGAFGVGTVLAAATDYLPGLAAGFAMTMFITAALGQGDGAWKGIAAATAAAPAKSATY